MTIKDTIKPGDRVRRNAEARENLRRNNLLWPSDHDQGEVVKRLYKDVWTVQFDGASSRRHIHADNLEYAHVTP